MLFLPGELAIKRHFTDNLDPIRTIGPGDPSYALGMITSLLALEWWHSGSFFVPPSVEGTVRVIPAFDIRTPGVFCN
jgi:hypothetical protein